MGRHFCSTRLSLAACGAGLIACASLALADDARYCVTCKNPDQTYVCHIIGESAGPSDALKLYCVIRTAKEGNHTSCSAERSEASCRGIEKDYSYDGPMIPPDIASDPHVQKFMDKVGHDQRAFEKPKREAPQTLVELGGRAVSASRQGWRNARTALGGSSNESQPLPVSPQTTGSTEAAAAAERPEPPRASRAQRASSAMGSFARKSYRCLRSLFRNCSGETASGQAVQ